VLINSCKNLTRQKTDIEIGRLLGGKIGAGKGTPLKGVGLGGAKIDHVCFLSGRSFASWSQARCGDDVDCGSTYSVTSERV
jgi:hypothetical protein